MGLFHQDEGFTTCKDVANLPLIVSPLGRFEVLAPGSIYQPILLTPNEKDIWVGPGTLDKNEEKFVRDLIGYLYPKGNHPISRKTPLKWEDRDLWLKRNIEKNPSSFRLRIDEHDWFYPDFILWILDHENKIQTLGFVDPKGLAIGATGGWSDYKILSTLYMPHVVERQLSPKNVPVVNREGDQWRFRIRGVIVSTSPFDILKDHDKFLIRNDECGDAKPKKDDFERARIVFQTDKPEAYIPKVLELLTYDNALDSVLKVAAKARELGDSFHPSFETDYDMALRRIDGQTDSGYISAIIRDYLKLDVAWNVSGCAQKRRRLELLDYLKGGFLGLGSEKGITHSRPPKTL